MYLQIYVNNDSTKEKIILHRKRNIVGLIMHFKKQYKQKSIYIYIFKRANLSITRS